jgi:hypothetical protein
MSLTIGSLSPSRSRAPTAPGINSPRHRLRQEREFAPQAPQEQIFSGERTS